MKQRYLKKPCSFLLVSAMVLTMFPTFSTSVHAEENQSPTKEQFSTVEELKNYDTNDNDGVKNPAKVYFGNNNQQWWIAGSQSNDSITLFSASSMRDDVQFESNYMDNKTYDDKWNCTYPDREPAEVFPNHYGASYIRNVTLKEMEASFFTSSEQALINETTVYTDDTKNNSVYSTTDKLYLAYGDQEDYNHITVGKNSANDLNDGLRIDPSYWGKSVLELFWIRSPFVSNDDPNDGSSVLTAWPSKNYPAFNGAQTSNVEKIRPAFELNSSTILFASAVPSATSTGNLTLQDTDGDGAFTLRYDAGKYSKNLGSAVISYDESKVILTDVPNGTYLVAQNSNGAYAKQITNETEVSASGMNLDNFANCKIWLETTDTANRITYAALAEKEQETAVNIVADAGLNITSNNGVQEVVPNKAITDIIVEAVDGYFLPDGYEDRIQGLNGLTVTKMTKNGFTISGTPISDVNITLPPATKAVYSMLLSGDGTFTGTCVGYQPINAKEFTITNSGNVDLENVDISITGTDKDKFELSGDGTTTIQPNDTLKVAVAPKDSLATGIYRATLTVTAANAQIATTELQFTVNEHDYVAVVTPPNCTEKGYTTYTCRNCSHSYKGNEVDATGHTWGKWKVIKEATTTETGKKERVCERCDYKEIAVISMISNKEQPTTSTKPDTAVKTGDSTNILLWSMVMVISLAGMLTALFFKRRRNR
ncbi:hypothetical protein LIP55_09755 [[Ruminococcus] gnavus]|nr:hypothetical protein [Mediterraneibacter gnavus]